MRNRYLPSSSRRTINGFTIIELIVIISVIGVLASIVVISYNNWKQTAAVAQLKSDLNGAATAMENARIFGSAGYPSDVNNLTSFRPSDGVTITGGSVDSKTYCIRAVKSSQYPDVYYSINSDDKQPVLGQCVPSVVIGTQTWAATNANEGAMLTAPAAMTNNSVKEKYCYNNDPAYCTNYGGLYTWDEAMQGSTAESAQGICLPGYHIPTDGEWKTLESYLGMPAGDLNMDNAWVRGQEEGTGTKLKEGGSSRFNAKQAGFYDIGFNYISTGPNTGAGGFWTSTLIAGMYGGPINRIMEGPAPYVGRFLGDNPGYGNFRSVRCIKN